MADILHKVGIHASAAQTYKVLTAREGLAGWWTTDTQGTFDVGGVIEFRFGDNNRTDMKVLELEPERRVVWEVVKGPNAWIGSRVVFELRPEKNNTFLLFRHEGWTPSEFMNSCSTKWAMFMMSLKSLVETGKGQPFPNDVQISFTGH
jgi:uncharacterized protein YndB with AHSA1/START domain